jgi:hypothetical protein
MDNHRNLDHLHHDDLPRYSNPEQLLNRESIFRLREFLGNFYSFKKQEPDSIDQRVLDAEGLH